MIRMKNVFVLGILLGGVNQIHADSMEDELFKSIVKSDVPAIKNIIADGVNVNADNGKGHTALSFALVVKNPEVLTELANAGAKMDVEILAEKAGCEVCHSSASGLGVSDASISLPHLAAQNEKYLVKQMLDFHSGKRKVYLMDTPSKVLIKPIAIELAKYYSSLPRYENSSDAEEPVLSLGRNIYQTKCQDCHGTDGISTINEVTPTLSGMDSTYTSVQLTNYQKGVRTNDASEVMRSAVTDLSREEIKAVSEYVQNLK